MDPSPLATPVDTRGQAAVPAAVADYVVVRQLGEGNHGRYYLARPPARLELAEEFVALKVFGDRVGELAYERGVRELRAFAAVRSPYLVTVYDAVLEDTFAYAMQYFPLGSLSAPARPLAENSGVGTAVLIPTSATGGRTRTKGNSALPLSPRIQRCQRDGPSSGFSATRRS